MSNVTVTPAPEVAVSPKIIADVRAFVDWHVNMEGKKSEKLKAILTAATQELKRGVTKKTLTQALKDAGLDAGLTSNIISQASPVSAEAQSELAAVDQHNAKLGNSKTGLKVGFYEQTKIAKGETTLEQLLAKKQSSLDEGKGANRQATGARKGTPPTPPPAAMTLEEATLKISAVLSLALKAGVKLVALEEATSTLFLEWHEKIAAEKAKVKDAAKDK